MKFKMRSADINCCSVGRRSLAREDAFVPSGYNRDEETSRLNPREPDATRASAAAKAPVNSGKSFSRAN